MPYRPPNPLLGSGLVVIASMLCLVAAVVPQSHAQGRGRKYKAPPETSHVTVEVLRDNNSKPIANAAVVFHPTKDGHDEGNLEVKTNEEGLASIDVIPTGSKVEVQVIASGFATFAAEYYVPERTREIHIKMLQPRAQVSAYEDNTGKASQTEPGVQEPDYLKKPATAPTPVPTPAAQPGTPNAQPGTVKQSGTLK